MSDTIKTTLTADGSSVATELNRVAGLYQAHQSKVQKTQQNATATFHRGVTALRLEAAGHAEAAAAIREKITLQEQAQRLSAATGYSEAYSLQLVHEKLAVEKQLAAQRAATASRAGQLPEMALTPQYLQTMERGITVKKELTRQAYAAGRGGMAGSMGFLAFSQAVEDAQYGIRGVLNNIPQMVMGFGGTMGLAGAISLASVAAVALYPQLKKLYGTFDSEALEKSSKAFGEVMAKGYQAIAQSKMQRDLAADIANFTAAEATTAAARLQIQDQMIAVMEKELVIRAAARAAADEITAANSRLTEAGGGDTSGDSIQRLNTEIERLHQDAASQRAIGERASAEAARFQEDSASQSAETAARIAAYEQELAAAEAELTNAQARIARNQAAIDAKVTGKELVDAKYELRINTEIQKKIESSIERMKAEHAALKTQEESNKAATSEVLKQLQEKISSTYQESEAIKKLVEQKKELLTIETKIIEANKLLEEGRQEVEDAIRSQEESAKDAADTANEQDQIRSMAARRAAITAEMEALRLERSGHKEKADALREELRIRTEAAALVEDGVMNEERALAYLRKKARLEREIARGKFPGGRPSNIRRSERDNLYSRFGGSHLEGRGGFLRDSILDKRGTARAAREAANKQESQAKFWEKQLDLQERIVKKFDKLGVV